MKKYYLIKYSSQNCFEAYIVNEKNYKHLKEKMGVVYDYITFEDITGKKIRINKENLSSIILEEIVEKVEDKWKQYK